MKSLADLLLLGDPRLYERCAEVQFEELSKVSDWVKDLENVMSEIRRKYQFGRGIAAPQIGVMKRLFYMNIDHPLVIINPKLEFNSPEQFELWDDCMSFPNLLVKVRRYKHLTLHYKDENWEDKSLTAVDAMSELIQHEYDHLEGILCIDRAIDNHSFKWRL